MTVKIHAVVISKTLVTDHLGNKLVKVDIAEEHEMPSPVFTVDNREAASIMRDIAPVLQQVLRSLPFMGRKYMMPRVTLWFTEEEWESFSPKPEVGDVVEIVIENGTVKIRRVE